MFKGLGEVGGFIANGKSTLEYLFDMIKWNGVRKSFLTDRDLFLYLLGPVPFYSRSLEGRGEFCIHFRDTDCPTGVK